MSHPSGRVVLASGGTAGHVYPALAVAEELRSRGENPLFVLPEPEFRGTLEAAGYECRELPAGPWLRQTAPARARSVARVASSVVRGVAALRRWNAGVVLGFGSYGSVAPLLAARLSGIPTAILEPNAVPGLANRFIAKFVSRIYLGSFTSFPGLDERRVCRTGMPVRRVIESVRREASSSVRRLVVIGDPQRSGFLDLRMPAVLSRVVGTRPVDIIHLTAADRLDDVRQRYAGCAVRVEGPTTDIHDAYAAADFLISRAGASTLAELAVAGLPSLLVPLADAAEDHQTKNAEVFQRAGAALVRPERGWDDGAVADDLRTLIAEDDVLERMSVAAASLGACGAAARLAADVICVRNESPRAGKGPR